MSGGQQVLAYQKERIQVLCSEQGRQIEQLKKLVRSFDRRKNKLQKSVECVDAEWLSLNLDVQKMCKAAVPAHDLDDHTLFDEKSSDEIHAKEPFLRRLLQGVEAQKIKEVQDMLTDAASSQTVIDVRVEEKMADTRMALTCVLDYICKQDLKRLNNKVKGFMNEDQRDEFKKETLGLQNKVNGLQALYRTAEDQVRQVQNLYFETQQRNKELDSQLEETRAELQSALNHINALEPETGQKGQKRELQPDKTLKAKKGPPDLTEHVQAVVKERDREFETSKSKQQALKRKLEEKQQELDGAMWVKHSKQFKQLQQRLQEQTEEREKIQSSIVDVEREMVYVRHLDNQHKLKIEECERLKSEIDRLTELRNRIDEDLGVERKHEQDMLSNIRALKTTVGDDRTLAHWRLMFQALEDQRQTLDYKNKQIEDQCQRIVELEKNSQGARTFCERLKAENERLKQRAKDRESRITAERQNNRKLEDKVFEMDCFVSKITEFKTEKAAKSSPAQSESDTQSKIKVLQQRLQGIDSGEELCKQLDEREKQSYEDSEQSSKDCNISRLEVFRLKKQVHRRRQQLQQSQDECSYYLNEIEVTGKGYENMVAENKELQKYMESKNEEVSHIILEKQKVNLEKEQVTGQLKQLQTNTSQQEQERQELQQQRHKLAEELHLQHQDFTQDLQKATTLQQQIFETKLRQNQLSLHCESKSIVVENLQGQSVGRKRRLEEIQQFIEENTKKRVKTEEENTNMKRALLGDEVCIPGGNRSANDVFRQLKCSVCSSRQKSTILVRCLHTFCKECINRCLETRQRRCPKCKTGFTNNEVKPFSLD
eukprot:TRINITY_DN1540_c0_g1_i1.p1 TRINITY_DN1540_c0_g1~~TRINITY_DN1540_c0_g1_i1.p1  ORF type:complete len:827 (+),score=117.62 TRINITY_DN1540_c0_g1_i1:117-2597(+)